MEEKIPTKIIVSHVNTLLDDKPELLQEFQKFFPVNLEQNSVEKQNPVENDFHESIVVENNGLGDYAIQEVDKPLPIVKKYHRIEGGKQEPDFKEPRIVNKRVSKEYSTQEIENNSQEVDFQTPEVVEKTRLRKDDIRAALVYTKRVLKGLKDRPDMIAKYFELIAGYKSDSDKEKLEHDLFTLFSKSHPEFEIEFIPFISEEPFPVREKTEVSGLKKDFWTNPLEDIKDMYEDKIFENEMSICRINSAIENTVKFLMACQNGRRTVEVTKYLTDENVKEILTHCKVNLKNCKHPQESANKVVAKLKVQLEVTKKDGDNIRRNMTSEIQEFQKLQNKKRRVN